MKKISIIPAYLFIFWAGFVCAISFMEAWLKFQAPGVTLTIGLSIGMKVFKALNIVEWTMLLIALGWILPQLKSLSFWLKFGMITNALILLLQSFVLIPDLTLRAMSLIENRPLPPNPTTHITYIVFEIIKVALLVAMTSHWMKLMHKSKSKNKYDDKTTMERNDYNKIAV